MLYLIIIKKQAQKKLLSLSRNDRVRIAEKIELLGFNPEHSTLDVKKMVGEPLYRLRVGNWRVIFDRQDRIKVIAIEKIDARGGVYK